MNPPEPELTPDLEWMLQSVQVSDALLVETIAQEYGTELYRLAQALCDRPGMAWLSLSEALVQAARRRREYLPGLPPRLWLAGILVDACRKRSPWPLSPVLFPYALWRPRTLSRQRRLPHPPAGTGQLPWQVDLWMALDLFTAEFRLPVLLHYLFDLQPVEITALLGDDYARTCLATARSWLQETLHGSDPSQADALIAQELKARWHLPDPSHPELRQAIDRAMHRLRPGRAAFNRLGGPHQAGLLGLMVVFAVVAGWLTRDLGRDKPRATPVKLITQLVQVTRMVTPSPQPAQPLSIDASEASIRQRMMENRDLWSSIWVDALLVDYGPVGYIGPAREFRSQMWVRNPTGADSTGRRLVVSGTVVQPGGGVLQIGSDLYDIDLPTGLSSKYSPGEAFTVLRNPAQVEAMTPHRWMIHSAIHNGSALARLLFSDVWAQAGGRLEVLSTDRIFGRDVLVVEHFLDDQPAARIWLDAATGITLRWERFAGGGDRTVIEEMVILNLEMEASFPMVALTAANSWRQPVTWETLPGGTARDEGLPAEALHSRQPIRYDLSLPADFDIAHAALVFQWKDTGTPGWNPTGSTAIYARHPFGPDRSDYYLGTVELGSPWSLSCERSPDGTRIAFTSYPYGASDDLFAEAGPFWLDLTQPGQVNNALPHAEVVSGDFAFSPDGTGLAFWACEGGPFPCGIYLHDLQALETKRLANTSWGATNFHWSPDGEQLALLAMSSTLESTGYLVMDMMTGKQLDGGPIRWPELSLPGDEPNIEWSIRNPQAHPGLEGCLGFPSGMNNAAFH